MESGVSSGTIINSGDLLNISESKYRIMFQLNPQPMWIYDIKNFGILDVNEAAIRVYGYSRDEFLSLTIKDLRPAEEIPVLEKALSQMCSQEAFFSKGVYRHKKKNGAVIQVLIQGNIIYINGIKAELILSTDITAIVLAENEREMALKQLKHAQKIARLGYWSRHLQEKHYEWSEEMFEIFGTDPETYQPNSINLLESFHPDDRPFWNYKNRRILFELGTIDLEHRIITKSGDVKWVFQRLELQKDAKGKYISLVGTMQDITERVEQQNKLKRSERRFEALVQEGADLIAVLDMHGNYKFVAESSNTVLGINPEEFIGKNAFDFIHPQDNSQVMSLYTQLAEHRQFKSDPYRFKDSDGNWRWIASVVTNLADDPAVGGIVVNSRDITNEIQKSTALKASNDRYKLILKAANEAIYDWDIEKDVVEWGVGFQEIFEYDLSKYNNNLWSDNIYYLDRTRVLQEMETARSDAATEVMVSEFRYLKSNGTVRQVEHRIIFLRNAEGLAIRAVGSLKDITDYKQSLLKIQLQNKQLKEIAWAQSHHVRAPLARMLGLINLIEMDEQKSKDHVELLEHIRSSAEELDAVIKDIVCKAYKVLCSHE